PDEQARAALAANLTRAWRGAVERHLAAKPFTRTEWQRLAGAEGPEGERAIEAYPILAYGSTLLAAVATQSHVLALQLGDGDILFVDADGRSRRAIPGADPPAPKGAPDSLAQEASASRVRIHIREAAEGLPALVLAATDGYTD